MIASTPTFASVTDAATALVRSLATKRAPVLARDPTDTPDVDAFVAALAREAGLATEHVPIHDEDLASLVTRGVPFVFVPSADAAPDEGRAFAVSASTRRRTTFLSPDGTSVSLATAEARALLRGRSDDRIGALAGQLLDPSLPRNDALLGAMIDELRAASPLGRAWVFRPDVAASVPTMLRSLRLGGALGRLLALSGVQSLLILLSWAAIGSLAIRGHAARGSLVGWALLSVTATFVQMVATRFVGRFTIRAATAIRQRMLEGALALSPEGLGSYGLGGLMVIASQADAFMTSVIVLIVALLGVVTNAASTVAVLGVAPMAGLTLPIFGAFFVGAIATFPRLAGRAAALQDQRMALTTDIVERMVGHRTRLVQQTPGAWHEGEDAPLRIYAEDGRSYDRMTTIVGALPRAHYVVSIAVLFFILAAHPTPEVFAVSLGGMMLGMATLGTLVALLRSAAELHASWRAIRPIVDDGQVAPGVLDAEVDGPATTSESATSTEAGAPIVELRGIRFAYPTRTKPVFDDASLRLARGDRVLVEGRSGGGKTTLAALVTGLRHPDAGLVLVGGLDQHTIRDVDLRRVVASAPQFYKNHVFSESLAFNLLMGRRWPPTPTDLRDALVVARALGLGPLLERMPSGVFQFVGETGWQLSHGEKSRVYLARTLLQPAELVILDETLGALDPDTLRTCMDVVLARARSLLVITHR